MKQLISLFLLSFCIFTIACSYRTSDPGKSQPAAKQGALDLSNWDFDKDSIVTLDGEWEFYWNQLLDPDDFSLGNQHKRTGYIALPGGWNNFILNGKKLPGVGYATFRLIMRQQDDGIIKSLQIGNPFSAHRFLSYRLWFNGNLLSERNEISKSNNPKIIFRERNIPLAESEKSRMR